MAVAVPQRRQERCWRFGDDHGAGFSGGRSAARDSCGAGKNTGGTERRVSTGMWQRIACPFATSRSGGATRSHRSPASLRGQREANPHPLACTNRPRRFALQFDSTLPDSGVDDRHGGEQGFRIGVVWRRKHCVDRSDFDDLASMHDDYAISNVPDDAQIVGNEQQRRVVGLLGSEQQLDDGGLYRRIERGDRLVGDDDRWTASGRPRAMATRCFCPPES